MTKVIDKYERYKERILWKAGKHDLFDKSAELFSSLSPTIKSLILEKLRIEDEELVLAFVNNKYTWTVLGVENIYSFFNDEIHSASLDLIAKDIEVFHPQNATQEEIKRHSNFLHLINEDVLVWAPSGAEMFGLMSILRMFPLGTK
ncbi:hypothetical protein [Kangiella sp. HZ709]|uniref:hypothetical protein n=1 Tax=Kangiella sp. HZ709 TaxID=2666328 RepID=UPI0012AF03F9|nr:hypothetical protein [Kangiella sp. HZ709]MRX27295.1 hypothetical protein [Kangiella sp. HZ709]